MSGAENRSYEPDDVVDIKDRNGGFSKEMTLSNSANEKNMQRHEKTNSFIQQKYHQNRRLVKISCYTLLHIIFVSYFAYATFYFVNSEKSDHTQHDKDGSCRGKCGIQWCNGYGMLVILTSLVYLAFFYYFIFKPQVGKSMHKNILKPFMHSIKALLKSRILLISLILIPLVALAIYLYFETRGSEERLISLIAPVVFILTGYIFSTDRKAVRWRLVLVGVACQFILGLVCIRWEVGRHVFQCIGDKVAQFLSYTSEGTKFVFGEELVKQQIFAFAILPVIFFFSFFISILYHLGVMQWVISKLGWILQTVLGTTLCESVNAAANVFLGMTEAPLMIRPYIRSLTKSELHSVMVSGFATVSGTVLAAYMSFGAQPAHLITSSVMAAPATLAFSKLYLPETEESRTKSSNIALEKSKDSSLLDAASNGASAAIEIILGIIANLVAFVAFIAFVNGVVQWFGYLIGQDGITFEWMFSKLFIPLSWSMGVPWKECNYVAEVIATKTIINEFVAYKRLGEYIKAGLLSPRSAGIATFAICGFANPSSLGILIGSLGAMAPERKPQITTVAFRAFVVGSIVCFVSASFAGLLMTNEVLSGLHAGTFNMTQNLL